jgi:predicted nucleotidyltransferase
MTAETAEARDLRKTAADVAQQLARFDDIIAVCLVGSVARGDAVDDSDLDLVVLAEERLRRSDLVLRLPRKLRLDRLSLLCFSRRSWAAEAEKGSLFVHHARLEGVPLLDRDGALTASFELAARTEPNVNQELRRQLARLRLYRNPERLNGEHLFALSHLYAIGKAVAIARCVQLNEPIFVKEEALARVGVLRPHLAGEASALMRLRPFYDLTRERDVAELPFEPVEVEDQIQRARAAIERLAYG